MKKIAFTDFRTWTRDRFVDAWPPQRSLGTDVSYRT